MFWYIKLGWAIASKLILYKGKPREYAYHRSGEENTPRYMPLGSHGLGDHLESHILFHEEDGSLFSRNYTHTSSNSYRNPQFSPLPPSPGMPSPGSCWPVADHSSEAPISPGLGMASLHTTDNTHIVLPPTPSEICRSACGNDMLHKATGNLSRESMTSHNVESTSRMAIGHGWLKAKEAEEGREERKHNQTKSEVHSFCISIYSYAMQFSHGVAANTYSSKHSSCPFHGLNRADQIRLSISKALEIVSCPIQNRTVRENG